MSLNSKIILSFLAGTFAALLAWVVVDFNPWHRLPDQVIAISFSEAVRQQMLVAVMFGSFLGMAIGGVNGVFSGSPRLMRRYIGWGFAIGLFGGVAGLFFGQLFYGYMHREPRGFAAMSGLGPFVFVWNIIARAIGWSLIGFFVGFVQGIPVGSKKAVRHGAIGGFIGGILGGTLFEIVPWLLPPGTDRPGVVSRGISMTVTGASIGFFIGLVEILMKQAWIRVLRGRSEGREYVISKPRTSIGRNELSDIGLFGDMDIALTHAFIEAQDGRHVLRDAGSAAGTAVNGQRITEYALKDGDVIGIVSMQLEFHEKATASRIAPPVDVAPRPSAQIPTIEGICPYCGSKKDPNTGACACAVEASTAAGTPSTTPTTPPAASAVGVGPRLVGVTGPHAGQSFGLSPSSSTSVGREPGKDIQLPLDPTVSRTHARIENEGGAFVVYDEGSSNGTTVNGVRITRQVLAPGDTIQFGSSSFRFEQ